MHKSERVYQIMLVNVARMNVIVIASRLSSNGNQFAKALLQKH